MKRRVLAMALLGAIGAAGAQTPPSSVTLYGIFDTGVEHLTNVNAAGDSLTRMPNLTGSLPSRVGLRGSEDLGGGLRAEFTLENGFNPDDGNLGQGGRLFGRQAWVGVGGAWGGLSMGRVYTMLFWANLGADILGPNLYGLGSLDNYIPNSRSDNSIAYRGTFSGFSIGGTYSFGRDTSAAGGPAATNCPGESPIDSSRCRQWSAMLKYDASNWGLAASIDKKYGGPGAAFGLTSSSLTDTRTTYSGYFQFANKMKFGAGLLARENQGSVATPDSDLWWLGFSTPFAGSWMFETQAMMLDYDNSDNDTDLLAVRVMYNFSRRTAAYLNLGFANNDGTAAVSASSGGSVGPGMNQTGVMIGMRHFF
jgi:predicted porin